MFGRLCFAIGMLTDSLCTMAVEFYNLNKNTEELRPELEKHKEEIPKFKVGDRVGSGIITGFNSVTGCAIVEYKGSTTVEEIPIEFLE